MLVNNFKIIIIIIISIIDISNNAVLRCAE